MTTTTKQRKQRKNETKPYVSFRIHDVEISDRQLYKENVTNNIKNGIAKTELYLSYNNLINQDPYQILGLSYSADVVANMQPAHPVLNTINEAFNNHLPLTFSPDTVWLTIVQGLAQHVNMYPEEHRKFLVEHEGKKELEIFRPDLSIANLENIGQNLDSIVNDFMPLIQENTSPLYYNLVQGDFSTTTTIERTAFNISCMEFFSPYLIYKMYCGCGFPEVRLMGTLQDWLAIRSKVDQIEELFYVDENVNLTWWTCGLKRVCDNFITAFKGKVNLSWWQKMYKQFDVYLSRSFNGWVGWLFPYVKTPVGIWPENKTVTWTKNPMLDNLDEKNDKQTQGYWGFGQEDLNPGFSHFLSSSVFPAGLSKVDLKIVDLNLGTLDTKVVGGFLGVKQESDSGLAPLIGYGILA